MLPVTLLSSAQCDGQRMSLTQYTLMASTLFFNKIISYSLDPDIPCPEAPTLHGDEAPERTVCFLVT